MAQHFLLSPEARTLSIAAVLKMSDEEAAVTFCRFRWPSTGGEPICPSCGGLICYRYRSRPVFKCKACCRQFSATSGTLFAWHKLPLRFYLLAMAVFVNAVKGLSALPLGRDLGVSYKTLAGRRSACGRRNEWRYDRLGRGAA